MKIGIVTQPLCANYGGILQNYALQQILIKMGHDPITLDYLPSLSFGRYILYALKGIASLPFPSKRHKIKPYRHYLRRPKQIESFVRKNIKLTKTIPEYNKTLLRKNEIEAIVVGSDQVWRYSYNSHYIEDMYLDFAKRYSCLKMAYGASFGIEEWDYPTAKTEAVKKLVKQFDSISVREVSGVKLCKDILGIDAQYVIDPTMLLERSDYERICAKPDIYLEPYIATYVLDDNEEKEAFINSVAVVKNLPIKRMSVYSSGSTVEEWLSTIKNADFIITDSYHGSLFSIIFGKQFRAIINKDRGSDRFYSIFSKLGILNCLMDTIPNEFDNNYIIDYDQLYLTLNSLRKESMFYLSNTMGHGV